MATRRWSPPTTLGILLACGACALGDASGDSWQTRRAAFETRLAIRGPGPGRDSLPDIRPVYGEVPPGTFEAVTYPGPEGEMKAWLYVPAEAQERPARALVFLHPGWSLSDWERYSDLKPFLNASFVVMWPAYRGENGNPGDFDAFFGDVEDAAAAARWLADRPTVDPERVYALGWSSGGGVSALLSLVDDVPLRHTASSGGLYHTGMLRTWARNGYRPIAFDTTRSEEFALRVLPGNFQWMKRPHYAFIETAESVWIPSIQAAMRARERGDNLIHLTMVPGDHSSIFPEVVDRYLEMIRAEER